MIPILFDSNAQTFATQGLGALIDTAYCRARTELNGEMELELQYPVDGLHREEITHRRIILAKPSPTANPQPYRIYAITKPMGGLITVHAHHISYDLSGYPVTPYTAANVAAALQGISTNAVGGTPFTMWTDKTTTADFTLAAPASARAVLGGVAGSILDTYGGEFEFDGLTVRLRSRVGADRGVRIAYGVNLIDLQQEENISKLYTGVYPYWSRDGQRVEASPQIVPAPGTYNYTNVLVLDLTLEYQEQPTPADLLARAQKYIQDNEIGVPSVSLDVKFYPLEQTEEYRDRALLERVELGDTVTVYYTALGIDAQARVRSVVYDVLQDRYDTVHLGAMRSTLSATIAHQQKEITEIPGAVLGQVAGESITMTDVEQAVQDATDLITGSMGGYVKIVRNAAGEPTEILIMDQPDTATATKVWRWNQAGLGYSSQGYNGPYTTAITQNGQIVADFITAGTLSGSMVTAANLTAGTIQSQDGQTFVLNLNTGSMSLDGSSGGGISIKNAGISILNSQTYYASNYTSSDTTRAQNIILGTVTPTAADLAKYDFYGDGKITLQELLCIQQMVLTGNNLTVTWYAQLDTSKGEIFKIWRQNTGANTASQTLIEVSAGGVILPEYALLDAEYQIKYEDIPNGANLNDYHQPGYYRSTSVQNTSISNKPGDSGGYAFELVVTGISDYSYCTQWLKDHGNNRVFVRTQTSWQSPYNSWTPWTEFYTTTYKPTPAAIGAAARTESSVTVSANSAISLSLSDGEMAYLGYTTSTTSAIDITLLVNGASPETSSYTYAGSSSNFDSNIFARGGSAYKGTFTGWIAVHGSTVEVWGFGRRGNNGAQGNVHMSWNLSSVSSITISQAGSLTITKLS